MLAEFRQMRTHIQELEEKIKSGADSSSIARSVAVLFVQEIGRCKAFLDHFEMAMGHQMFLDNLPLEENARRAKVILRIYSKLMSLLIRATDGVLLCIGGERVIAAESLATWAANWSSLGPADPRRKELFGWIVQLFGKTFKGTRGAQ